MSAHVRLVILGRQGSGKGTQGVRVAEQLGIAHISTGDMLRAAAVAGTPMGLEAKAYMDRGDLLPDDVMQGVVAERLQQDDARTAGFLLDGFPRTVGQAEALEDLAGIDLAIDLDVPYEVVMERMLARGRTDDTPDAIKRRLDLYEEQTHPLLDLYGGQGKLVRVDGVGTEAEVEARLLAAIESARAS